MAGDQNGANILMDNNEIMARNNGVGSTLFLNHDGGNVVVANAGSRLGVGLSAPSQELDVRGDLVASSSSSHGTYLGLFKGQGSLPGYPSNYYPTVKTDFSNLYFSAGGAYSSYISTGGTYNAVSSQAKKENIVQLDKQEILSKINALEITEWNYKMESPEVKHIGPFAEEFHAQFGLNGSDNTMISTTDPSGVALVGVQALTERNAELSEQVEELKAELEAIKATLNLDGQAEK